MCIIILLVPTAPDFLFLFGGRFQVYTPVSFPYQLLPISIPPVNLWQDHMERIRMMRG
jgi:hypothetical protein